MESPPRLDAIVFRNFYCSHITIKQHKQIEGAPGVGKEAWVWATILRDRPVMEDPHHEDDAQYWHVVAVEEFSQEYDADSAAPLRYTHPFGRSDRKNNKARYLDRLLVYYISSCFVQKQEEWYATDRLLTNSVL